MDQLPQEVNLNLDEMMIATIYARIAEETWAKELSYTCSDCIQ